MGQLVACAEAESGEWSLCEVDERLEHQHDGELVTVTVAGGSIEATGNHPFWIVTGVNLDIRPVATDVGPDALVESQHGRWVEASDVEVGDHVLLADGGHAAIEGVSFSSGSFRVFNLRVGHHHTYAVGSAGVLVHNKANVNKWSIRGRLRAASTDGLPGGKNASGPLRYRPPEDYNPANPLPRGPGGGYMDRFGNEWVPGPYHGDPKLPFNMEWDVQLTPQGLRHWNRFEDAKPGGYLNVRPDGWLSH